MLRNYDAKSEGSSGGLCKPNAERRIAPMLWSNLKRANEMGLAFCTHERAAHCESQIAKRADTLHTIDQSQQLGRAAWGACCQSPTAAPDSSKRGQVFRVCNLCQPQEWRSHRIQACLSQDD